MATNLSVIPQELKTITQSAATLSVAIARYTIAVEAQVDRRYGAQSATGKAMSQVTTELSILGDAINSLFGGFTEKDGPDMSASEVIDTIIRFSTTEAGAVLATQAQKEMVELITPFQIIVNSLLEPPPKTTPTIPIIINPNPRPIIPDIPGPIVIGPGGTLPGGGTPGPDPAPPFDLDRIKDDPKLPTIIDSKPGQPSTSTPVNPTIPVISGTIPTGPEDPSTISTPVNPGVPTIPGPIQTGPRDPSTISTPVEPGIPTIPGPIHTGPLDPSTISTPVDPGIPTIPGTIPAGPPDPSTISTPVDPGVPTDPGPIPTGPRDPSTISTPVRDPGPNIDPPPPSDPSTISTPVRNPPNVDPPFPVGVDPSTVSNPIGTPEPNVDPNTGTDPRDPSTIPVRNPDEPHRPVIVTKPTDPSTDKSDADNAGGPMGIPRHGPPHPSVITPNNGGPKPTDPSTDKSDADNAGGPFGIPRHGPPHPSVITPGHGKLKFGNEEMEKVASRLSPQARAIAEEYNEMLGGTLTTNDPRLAYCLPPSRRPGPDPAH